MSLYPVVPGVGDIFAGVLMIAVPLGGCGAATAERRAAWYRCVSAGRSVRQKGGWPPELP